MFWQHLNLKHRAFRRLLIVQEHVNTPPQDEHASTKSVQWVHMLFPFPLALPCPACPLSYGRTASNGPSWTLRCAASSKRASALWRSSSGGGSPKSNRQANIRDSLTGPALLFHRIVILHTTQHHRHHHRLSPTAAATTPPPPALRTSASPTAPHWSAAPIAPKQPDCCPRAS